jgi:hypothetical protein
MLPISISSAMEVTLKRPDPEGSMHPGRDLSQRTLSEARHDRIHHSKNTERHSALSVHSHTPKGRSAMSAIIERLGYSP